MILRRLDFPRPLRPTIPRRSPATRLSERFSINFRPPSSIDSAQLDHTIRQLRRWRNNELDVEFRFRRFLRRHFEIALDPIDRFRPARARRFPHPGQLALEKFLPLLFLHLLDRRPLGARQQVIGVVAGVAVEFPARKLDDARRDAVEKIAIMRHEKRGAVIAREKILQPLDRAGVEMVRRFVENQKVRPREESAAKRDAPLLAAG